MPWYRQSHWRILIALALGLVYGVFAAYAGWGDFTADWIAPFGTIFLRLLLLVAVPLVLASLGRKSKLEGTPEGNERAVEYLTLAIEAGSTAPSTFEDLADVLSVMGRNDESAEALKKGVDVSPFSPKLLKKLTLNYINLKRYEEAATSMKRYVELFPEDDLMRGLLRQVLPGSR